MASMDKFSYSLLQWGVDSCTENSHYSSVNLPREVCDKLLPFHFIPQSFEDLYCFQVQSYRIAHVFSGIPQEKVEGFVKVNLPNISGYIVWLNSEPMERVLFK